MQLYALICRVVCAAVICIAAAPAAGANSALDITAALAERVSGSPDAAVTIVEYASFTCPLCASFHTGADYEGLRKRFVDTGRVRLIYRDFPLDGVSLRASIAARCADRGNYFALVRALYENQAGWAGSENIAAALAGIAGVEASLLEACFASPPLRDGMLRMRQQGTAAGVQFTPTYIINGKVYPGSYSIEEFAEIIEPLLADK